MKAKCPAVAFALILYVCVRYALAVQLGEICSHIRYSLGPNFAQKEISGIAFSSVVSYQFRHTYLAANSLPALGWSLFDFFSCFYFDAHESITIRVEQFSYFCNVCFLSQGEKSVHLSKRCTRHVSLCVDSSANIRDAPLCCIILI